MQLAFPESAHGAPPHCLDLFLGSVLPVRCGVAGGLPFCDAEGAKERTSCR